ncbi:MAG: hypothetical protein K2Y37_17835 [Pirellulales bacterium]|nr:hypothetical protein [Pirellulales bacterium]
MRTGISLLEVLIAMFILSVGLLGLAALLPVGQADVVDAGKSERSSAAGRLAMRDLRARGMLAVDNWMNHDITDDPFPPEYNGGSGYIPGAPQQHWYDLDYNRDPTQCPQLPTPLDLGNAVCIDPLFITRNALALSIQAGSPTPLPPDWRGRAFPYFLDDPDNAILAVFNPTYLPPRMTRVNLRAWRYSAAQILPAVPAMTYPMAERIFMIQDDRLIDLPGDATLRSRPVYGTGRRQESAGDYSWMATIVPLPGSDTPYTALNPMYSRRRCEVSVAVFYKRNLVLQSTTGPWRVTDRVGAPPNERVVLADMLSGGIGWGGGDVRLRLPDLSGIPNPPAERSDMPRVRPNTWIMLAGWTVEGASGSPPPANSSITYAAAFMSQQVSSALGIAPPTPPGPYDARFPLNPPLTVPPGGARRAVFKWYRVISASPPTLNNNGPLGAPEWQVDVTLAGPDWNPLPAPTVPSGPLAWQYMDVDGTGPPSSYAILLENCIGVYTRTLEVNGTSGWQ